MTSQVSSIRRATPQDAPVVAALVRRMLEEIAGFGRDAVTADVERWDTFARGVRDDIASDERLVLLAGARNGALIARVEPPHIVYVPKRLLHVSVVWVEPGARRRGLARRLLDEAFAWGRAQGCEEARLNVLLANPAHALYRELGFEEVQVEMRRRL